MKMMFFGGGGNGWVDWVDDSCAPDRLKRKVNAIKDD